MIYYIETNDWPECRDVIGLFEGPPDTDLNIYWEEFCELNKIDQFVVCLEMEIIKGFIDYLQLKGFRKLDYVRKTIKTCEDDH